MIKRLQKLRPDPQSLWISTFPFFFLMVVLFVVSMGIRLPGPGGARLLASRSQAQSPELTRWVLTSGAPSRSWDMRELTVHAAMNASSPPGGPQGGAPETLLRASRARPLYSGKRLVFHAGPFLSCHGLPWGRISLGSRYSCRLKRQRVRGPGGSWLAWGLCVSPIAARRAGSGFPFLSCASGRARGCVCGAWHGGGELNMGASRRC